MEEKELQPNESLALIESMINTAKNKLADDGFYIIFWGWLVFVAALINYFSWLFNIQAGFLVWPILMPLGGIFSYFWGRQRDQKEKVKTHVESYIHYIWLSFGIAMGIALLFIGVHGMKTTYFFLMLLYAIATFSTGGLLSFRPLIIGSIASFVLAIVSNFIPDRELLLCLALSLLCSYIIPGHLLKAKYQSQEHV